MKEDTHLSLIGGEHLDEKYVGKLFSMAGFQSANFVNDVEVLTS